MTTGQASDGAGGASFRKAKDVCLRKLAVRARTRAELHTTLEHQDFEIDVIQSVLDKLDAADLINDQEFAETWVRSRHTYQGLGRRALRAELLRKGVATETADEAVHDLDDAAETERARALVRKRVPSLAWVDETTALRRLVAMLGRKGYPEGLSYTVANEELRAVHQRSV